MTSGSSFFQGIVAVAAGLLALFVLPTASAAQDLPAFPGAEGFGSTTPGGRGGDVLFVTNLNDSGPGSLRAAIEATGPRTVIFRVGGTIELQNDLEIRNPFITIAGQTAPGGGITLRGQPLEIETHDVIIRYIRVRLGDEGVSDDDSIWIESTYNVVLDHVSASWSIDETLSVTAASDVTVQWSFITESLNNSHHSKGAHGYGSLLNAWDGAYSFHHNLYAHHRSRNPRPQGDPTEGLLLDFRNNVVYDWDDRAGYTKGEEPIRMNMIGNYYRPGPSTGDGSAPFGFVIEGNLSFFPVEGNFRLHVDGNVVEGHPEYESDQWGLVANDYPNDRADDPFEAPYVTTHSAEEAYDLVLAGAGATLPVRDAVDERIVEQVLGGTGGIIDSQAEVGGWPELDAGTPPVDDDMDGMPDDWEDDNQLNSMDGTDHLGDDDVDGYTNLEEFLNGTNPQVMDVDSEQHQLPSEPTVVSSFPQPFSSSTTLTYETEQPGVATVTLWDALGRQVEVVASGYHATGTHRLTVEGAGLAPGVYLVTLDTEVGRQTHRLIRAR